MSPLSVDEALLKFCDVGKQKASLSDCVKAALDEYFEDLKGHKPNNLYRMVLTEVEKPLLERIMRHSRGNQSKAAQMLGINRSTLRKKLQMYDLM